MEQQQLKRCSIGVQTFEKVIEGNYLYIDKTEYIYRMVHGASDYYSLSCSCRFGKSLLIFQTVKYTGGADAKPVAKLAETHNIEKWVVEK
jgi:hypothetical protein